MLFYKKSFFSRFWFIVFIVFNTPLFAYKITGKVTNANNEPVPFVNVFIEGTSNGTSTNLDGDFFLEVKESGTYTIIFRCIGYQTLKKQIQVTKPSERIEVTLLPQIIEINEFVVKSNAEDPAYPIIRKAQQKRNFYKNQVSSYACRTYIKGMAGLKNVPAKILGQDIQIEGLDSTRSGIIYLSESISDFYFKAPDKKKEKMISSKVSGRSQGFSWNSASEFELNFYENSIPTPITDRDIISPIAADAMTYYTYELIGDYTDNGIKVYKIKVMPKLTGSPLLNGMIHIQDETWRIHSFDMYMTKDNGINFIDTLTMKVIFNPITSEIWMKGTQQFDFNFNFALFGIKGHGHFTGVFNNYELDKKYDAGFFNAEVLTIDENSNKKTAIYWDSIRPVQLTETETKDYLMKDSIEVLRESKQYLDSLDRKENKFKIINLIQGYNWTSSYHQLDLSFSSPIREFNFNSVEGIAISQRIELSKGFKKNKSRFRVYAEARYGFSSHQFYMKGGARHRFNATNRMYVSLDGGSYISQFNESEPISALQNTVYSIFWEENHMKLFQKNYAKAGWGMEVINGLFIETGIEFARRSPLLNSASLTPFFINWDNRSFTSNDPLDPTSSADFFTAHQAFTIQLHLKYTIGQQYMMRPQLKINYETKFPTLHLRYKRGVPEVTSSITDFDFLSFGIEHKINTGILGEFEYATQAGIFITKKHLEFIDYHHFNTTRTIFAHRFDLQSFRALPYYQFSTNEYYAEFHAQHHFKGWLFGKIPGIKKLKWQEVIGFHFLYTPTLKDYYEFTVGIENIFRIFRADFAAGFMRGSDPYFSGRIKIDF
jgi:hypothetical protein